MRKGCRAVSRGESARCAMGKANHERAGEISYHFERPGEIPEGRLDQIARLIVEHGAVGGAFVRENLRNACLVSYAVGPEGAVIGAVVLKHQKDHYRRRIESSAGLNLSGYLERGYTSVLPAWRGLGVAGRLIRGLTERSRDQRVYVTIDLENGPALKLTRDVGMVLAGSFFNDRTGRRIGVFINR